MTGLKAEHFLVTARHRVLAAAVTDRARVYKAVSFVSHIYFFNGSFLFFD
jgi:hypothetical protein